VKNLRVSNRYAKALLGLAEENQFSERAYEDMKLVFETIESNKELQAVLKSPIIRITRKVNILKALFESRIHPVSLQYLIIIARKKRASLIMGIAFEFLNVHRSNLNVKVVTLITVDEIDQLLVQKAKDTAAALIPDSNIEFIHKFDPSIMGGFILKIGDLLYDASIRRKFSDIKKHLLER
jgi:F-type H+-transporting ATPase subunit delta